MGQKRMFAFLLISGLCTLHSCLRGQYHFVNKTTTWYEAQSHCRDFYTDLATIDDQMDLRQLRAAISDNVGVWIGLYSQWQWSMPDHGDPTHLPWHPQEPNNIGGNESCGAFRKTSETLHDFKCSTQMCFICYNESSTEKYIPISENKTWEEAQQYCRKTHTDLVSVRNSTEVEALKNILMRWSSNCQGDLWTGLFRKWEWSDQSTPSNFWMRKRDLPDKQNTSQKLCAVLNASRRWSEEKCTDEKRKLVCYDDNLVLVKENKTWDEALDYCRRNHSDLVSVSRDTDEHWVKRRARNASTDYVWLGLRYSCALRHWHWVSGEGLCQRNSLWHLHDMCGQTGAVESAGEQQWVNQSKTERFNFICEKKKETARGNTSKTHTLYTPTAHVHAVGP